MMEPLLPQKSERPPEGDDHLAAARFCPSLDACFRLASFGPRLAHNWRWWWQVTTNADFLQSRRQPLKATLPIVLCACVLSDVISAYSEAGHWWWPALDLLALAGACWYRWSSMRADNLFVDVATAAVVTLVLSVQETDAVISTAYAPALGLLWWPAVMICAAFVGMHSLVVLWLWCLSVVWTAVWSETPQVESTSSAGSLWQGIIFSTIVAIGSVAVELAMSVLYREWQTQLRGNQKLLEGATDGFGVVDCISSLVLEASPKMLTTLGNASLVGHSLRCGIDDSQFSALKDFFGGTDSGSGPAPVLVTWSMGTLECEVRMVPYALQGSRILFSVQRVGEARSSASALAMDAEGGEVGGRGAAARGKAKPCSIRKVLEGPTASSRNSLRGKVKGGSRSSIAALQPPAAAASPGSSSELRCNFDNYCQPSAQTIGRGSDEKSQSSCSMSRGTVSLSSWTISNGGDGGVSETQRQQRKRKKVSLRTMGTQTPSLRKRPPAPMLASSFPSFEQAKAARRARLARRSAAIVEEGNPRISAFEATPLATRLHSLQTVARSCNVTGKGCCHKHIAWAGLQGLISDLMLEPCGDFLCFSGWQCPQCLAVHDYEDGSDVDDEEKYEEQFCTFCMDAVRPLLPNRELSRADGPALSPNTLTATEAVASDSASSSDELIGPRAGYEADLEAQFVIDIIESDG